MVFPKTGYAAIENIEDGGSLLDNLFDLFSGSDLDGQDEGFPPDVTPPLGVSGYPTLPPTFPNYSAINDFAVNYPLTACQLDQTDDCKNSLYQKPVVTGLGFATFYGYGNRDYPPGNPGHDLVIEVLNNRKGFTDAESQRFIDSYYMENQSDMTPALAQQSRKVVAFGATRTPTDLWRFKYLFAIDDPANPQTRFIGRIMIIDMAAWHDWQDRLSTISYSYQGWDQLPWVLDLSKNGFVQLPVGTSGDWENYRGGRPGVVVIDESVVGSYIN